MATHSHERDPFWKEHATSPVSIATLEVFVDQVMANLKAINAKNVERNLRLDALEAKVRELEARPTGAKYCGVWQDSLEYQRDDAVTKGGSLWIAKHNHVKSEPGVDHVSWQLAVQRGRDGRSTR